MGVLVVADKRKRMASKEADEPVHFHKLANHSLLFIDQRQQLIIVLILVPITRTTPLMLC